VDVLERRICIRIVAGDFLTDLLLLLLGGGSRGVDLEPAKLALRRLVRVLFLAVFTGSTAYGSTLTRISSFLRTNPPTAGP
jgi:hypothetical protein